MTFIIGKVIFKIRDLLQINMRKDRYLNGKQANDLTRYFAKEEINMVNKHLKMCSSLITIRKIQIKPTMSYHYLPGELKFKII